MLAAQWNALRPEVLVTQRMTQHSVWLMVTSSVMLSLATKVVIVVT
jgi:hypothetical protein